MISTGIKSVTRGLMLCCLLLVSNLTYSQWDFSRIETLTDEVNRLKGRGLYTNAFALYPTIMHQMRIHEGIFTLSQLPLLMEMATWHMDKHEFRAADGLLTRAEFYVGKNPNPLNNYRKLVLHRIYQPDEQKCFEREADMYLNPSKDCQIKRYFMADSLIAATKLMQKVVEISDQLKNDLIVLANLASYTAYCVYGVDGPNTTIKIQGNNIRTTDNYAIRERYRHQKWSRIQRRVLAKLETEFNYK